MGSLVSASHLATFDGHWVQECYEKLDIPLNQERINTSTTMPFGNVPKKNPGRYFEQFVKVLEPKQSSSSSSSTCFGSPPLVIATQTLVAVKGHQDAMAGMAKLECQKDNRAGTRIRIETVSLQKRKNEDEEQDFIRISDCIYHAAIKSI